MKSLRDGDPYDPISSDAGLSGRLSNMKLLSSPEASERANLSLEQIQQMCNDGVLPSIKLAGRWLIFSELTPIVAADQWMLGAVEASNPDDILRGKDVWQASLAAQELPTTSPYSWAYRYNQFVARLMWLHNLPSPSVLWRDRQHIKGWRGWTFSEYGRMVVPEDVANAAG